MNSIAEAVKNHDEAKVFAPADRDDFLRYLDTVTTEKTLFSRLTYWMVFKGLPAEQNEKYELVRQRALELKLWNGLDLKMERWKEAVPAEYKSMGDEAFSAQVGQDYADYINSTPAQQNKAQTLQPYTSKQLSEMTLPPIRYVVDGVIPMGIKWLQKRTLVVDPKRTPNIYREFSQYEYDTDKDGNFLPSVPDRDNHTIDSVAYSLDRLIFNKNEGA